MLERLKSYHPSWDCSLSSLQRKLRKWSMQGTRGQQYNDGEADRLMLREYEKGYRLYDGIRTLRHRLRIAGVFIGRYVFI